MRTFIAIDISPEIRSAIGRIQSHLKYAGADVKWVAPENIHLTMKFLGEIDETMLGRVEASLEHIARSTRQFEFSVEGVGVFPKIDFPRVIWIGLGRGSDQLTCLAALLDDEMLKLGFEKDPRQFEPHLTIGRVRSEHNKEKLMEKIISLPPEVLLESGSCRINSLTLFKSTLTPEGPIYSVLHEANFSK